jgi:hypothetical protein
MGQRFLQADFFGISGEEGIYQWKYKHGQPRLSSGVNFVRAAGFGMLAARNGSVEDGGVPFPEMAVRIEEIHLRVTGRGLGLDHNFERVIIG